MWEESFVKQELKASRKALSSTACALDWAKPEETQAQTCNCCKGSEVHQTPAEMLETVKDWKILLFP